MEFHKIMLAKMECAGRWQSVVACMHNLIVVSCCFRAGSQANDRALLTFEYVYNTIRMQSVLLHACLFRMSCRRS